MFYEIKMTLLQKHHGGLVTIITIINHFTRFFYLIIKYFLLTNHDIAQIGNTFLFERKSETTWQFTVNMTKCKLSISVSFSFFRLVTKCQLLMSREPIIKSMLFCFLMLKWTSTHIEAYLGLCAENVCPSSAVSRSKFLIYLPVSFSFFVSEF